MIHSRFATAADIDGFYGERPAPTMRAIAILMDDAPVAIIGLAQHRDRYQAFSEYKPALEPHLRSMAVLRAIKAAQSMIASAVMPVVAFCKDKPDLIERLGFIKVRNGAYLWPN